MPQHSILFSLRRPLAQDSLRLPPLLGRDATAVQGSLGNTASAQDTKNTLGWAGIGVGTVAGVCDQPLS